MTTTSPVNTDQLVQNISDVLGGKNQDNGNLVASIIAYSNSYRNSLGSSNAPAPNVFALNASTPSNVNNSGNIYDRLALLQAASIPTDRVSASASWWGYQIFFPESTMHDISTAGDVAKLVAGLVGAACALVPALLPFVPAIIAYVLAELGIMKAIDKGRGVKLSATWIAPVVLVPTAI